jgi:hypothetical protein
MASPAAVLVSLNNSSPFDPHRCNIDYYPCDLDDDIDFGIRSSTRQYCNCYSSRYSHHPNCIVLRCNRLRGEFQKIIPIIP